jgi:hypothetical protein
MRVNPGDEHRGYRRENVREQGEDDEPAQIQEAGREEEGPTEPPVGVAQDVHLVRESVADLRDQRCAEPVTVSARRRA